MKDFLQKIVSVIVSDPKTIEIQEEDQDGIRLYRIMVPEEEIGRLIGKEGKVIKAIRSLCHLKMAKSGEKILIKVGNDSPPALRPGTGL